MGFFAFVLLIVVILAVIGLGWNSFSSGIITGFEKVVDIGTHILKNLTQEAREQASPEQLRSLG
jgi:hypothetical protein